MKKLEDLKIHDTGVFNYDFGTYRSIQAISATLLDKLHEKSPAHVYEFIKNPPYPTPAMLLGTAIHFKCLEPELLNEYYCVKPEKPCLQSEDPARYKKWKEEVLIPFEEDSKSKNVLGEKEFSSITGVAQTMETAEITFEGEKMSPAELISRCKTETTLVCRDPITGVLMKARPDLDYEKKNAIIDLKSTIDMAAFENSARGASAFKLGYHRRAAFYIQCYAQAQLKPVSQYYFLVCEKKAPFGWRLFKCTDAFLDIGSRQVRDYINVIAECFKTNHWPSYEPITRDLDAPRWAKNGN